MNDGECKYVYISLLTVVATVSDNSLMNWLQFGGLLGCIQYGLSSVVFGSSRFALM